MPDPRDTTGSIPRSLSPLLDVALPRYRLSSECQNEIQPPGFISYPRWGDLGGSDESVLAESLSSRTSRNRQCPVCQGSPERPWWPSVALPCSSSSGTASMIFAMLVLLTPETFVPRVKAKLLLDFGSLETVPHVSWVQFIRCNRFLLGEGWGKTN